MISDKSNWFLGHLGVLNDDWKCKVFLLWWVWVFGLLLPIGVHWEWRLLWIELSWLCLAGGLGLADGGVVNLGPSFHPRQESVGCPVLVLQGVGLLGPGGVRADKGGTSTATEKDEHAHSTMFLLHFNFSEGLNWSTAAQILCITFNAIPKKIVYHLDIWSVFSSEYCNWSEQPKTNFAIDLIDQEVGLIVKFTWYRWHCALPWMSPV